MSKRLRVIFFALIVTNIIIFGIYFWHTRLGNLLNSKEVNNTSKGSIEQTISNGNGSPREYTERDLYRTIQATFVKVSDGKLYYKNRYEESGVVEKIAVDNSLLYICMPPTFSSEIKLDRDSTGYRVFVNPESLNIDLFESDPIAIATVVDESGQEKVNYIVSAKCSDVYE